MTVLLAPEPELGGPGASAAEEQDASKNASDADVPYGESEAKAAPIAMRATARLYADGGRSARVVSAGVC